jgi:hypothetical protein
MKKNSTDQESKISNIGIIEKTDSENEQQEEINGNRRTFTRSGQVVKIVVRTNLMHFNSSTIKDNYYEYGDEEGNVMGQIIDKFNSLNIVSSQQYAMLRTYNLKQGLHQYGQKGAEAALEEI